MKCFGSHGQNYTIYAEPTNLLVDPETWNVNYMLIFGENSNKCILA